MIVSAHRTPQRLFDYATGAQARGLKVIIAGAGGAAHLPGMAASMTPLPVLGVPVESRALKGMDSLLSIVQMPGGIPVGTLAIGPAGAKNAGLLAAAILGTADGAVMARLERFRALQTESITSEVDEKATAHKKPASKTSASKTSASKKPVSKKPVSKKTAPDKPSPAHRATGRAARTTRARRA